MQIKPVHAHIANQAIDSLKSVLNHMGRYKYDIFLINVAILSQEASQSIAWEERVSVERYCENQNMLYDNIRISLVYRTK